MIRRFNKYKSKSKRNNYDEKDDPNDEDYDYYGRNIGKKKKQQKTTLSSTKQSAQSEFNGKKSPLIPTLNKT
ncbi:MAG: hypothetical protein EZS28_046754 [Streblomastix strix]|uniref:Uncharacterized protein n=1 Tax=Streblomastix strix TaxID=222440 RepID=A0A5J4TIY5_9EUKA|nr:MAG: hypothetical protein EZS28_046754 [Streblomastix strix]